MQLNILCLITCFVVDRQIYTRITLHMCIYETVTMSTLNTSFKFHFGHILQRDNIVKQLVATVSSNKSRSSSSSSSHYHISVYTMKSGNGFYICREFRQNKCVWLYCIARLPVQNILASSASQWPNLLSQNVNNLYSLFRAYFDIFFFRIHKWVTLIK